MTWTVTAVGVLTVSTLLGQTAPVTIEIDAVFARHDIEATSYRASHFRTLIESRAGRTGADLLEPVHPYIMAIRNGSAMPVTTVAFRYPRVGTDGRVVHGIKVYRMEALGQQPFPPGATLLFTPDEQLTFFLNGRSLDGTSPSSPPLATFAARRDALLATNFNRNRFPKVTVSLDSVTLSDGRVIGPDQTDVVDQERRKILVDRMLLEHLSDTGLSDGALFQWLEADIRRWRAKVEFDPVTGLPDDVGIYQFSFQRSLLKDLRHMSRAGAVEWLKGLIDKKAAAPPLVHVRE